MNQTIGTIIVVAVLAAYCIWVIRKMIKDKNCGGSCGTCASSDLCHKDLYAEYKAEQAKEQKTTQSK